MTAGELESSWGLGVKPIDPGTLQWGPTDDSGKTPTFATMVQLWRSDPAFRTAWLGWLCEVPFESYCWECPRVTAETASQPFECVFIASPMLARMPPEPDAFAEHFRADRSIVTFRNLGDDAVLVAPSPGPRGTNYSHLASFAATAPAPQQDALWQAVGEAMSKRIGASPVWLSTAGLGVAWLHVRLDDRPKYYRHGPYRAG